MFYILALLVLMIPVLLGWGSLFARPEKLASKSLAVTMMKGMMIITLLFLLTLFFIPLTMYVEVCVICVGLFAFIKKKKYRKLWSFLRENPYLFPVLLLPVIFVGSYYPFVADHFTYYVPTVKWLTEVGLTPGLANLDLSLGQMSFWHIFQAGFSHFSDFYLRMNSVAVAGYIIYLMERKSWVHLLFLPLFFMFLQSPMPDLPAMAFSLIILAEAMRGKAGASHFALAIFIFGIKPTMIWLPVFLAIMLFKEKRKFPVRSLLPGLLILCLLLVKNIYTFGFPFFPVQVFDFNISWKPGAALLQISSELALSKTYDMNYSYAQIQQFSTVEKIRNWFLLPGIKGNIHLLFIVTLLVFLLICILRKSRDLWILFVAIIFKSTLILLFSAQYRFFLDVFLVVFFVLLNGIVTRRAALLCSALGITATIVFFTFPKIVQHAVPSFRLGKFLTGFTTNQLTKPAHFKWEQFETYKIGNLSFNVVKDYPYSFDVPAPAMSPWCVSENMQAGIFPQLRGPSLKNGFIWRPITDLEKQQLKEILKKTGF